MTPEQHPKVQSIMALVDALQKDVHEAAPMRMIFARRKAIESAIREALSIMRAEGVGEVVDHELTDTDFVNQRTGNLIHNDHPMRHWDRTCPACNASIDLPAPPIEPTEVKP